MENGPIQDQQIKKLFKPKTYSNERFPSFTMGFMVGVLQPWGKHDIPAVFVSSVAIIQKGHAGQCAKITCLTELLISKQ